jgi:hypothetical protein
MAIEVLSAADSRNQNVRSQLIALSEPKILASATRVCPQTLAILASETCVDSPNRPCPSRHSPDAREKYNVLILVEFAEFVFCGDDESVAFGARAGKR